MSPIPDQQIDKEVDEIFTQDSEEASASTSTQEFVSFAATIVPSKDGFDKTQVARLISQYGSSSSTAWLEFSRYKIWQAPESFLKENPKATFLPVQGYMQHKRYVFAWGNPLVSDVSLMKPTAKAFIRWAEKERLKAVWCCTDAAMEAVLGKDKEIGWSAVECIHEEVLEPEHILEMTSDSYRGKEGVHAVKDLKKNLRRAEGAGVKIEEMTGKWTTADRKQVEEGLWEWKKSKGMKGVQIASTTGQPWIDESHRRYLVARQEGNIVGILILTPIHGPYKAPKPAPKPAQPARMSLQERLQNLTRKTTTPAPSTTPPQASASASSSSSSESDSSTAPSPTFSRASSSSSLSDDFSLDAATAGLSSNYYLIKNAISFPVAPRGTSELLIHSSLQLLQKSARGRKAPTVTFGITASDNLTPIDNLSGWKIQGLSTIYGKVASTAGLLKRGDFRAKFDSGRVPMYVCYPKEEGFGMEGIKSLLNVLRK